MAKPQGNPPAPVAAPAPAAPAAPVTMPADAGAFDFSALQGVPTLQEGAPAAVQPQHAGIDSATYIEAARFSLTQHGDIAEVYARLGALAAGIQADKVNPKDALVAIASLCQSLAAVNAVKAEGLLSEIEESGGIDEDDADDLAEFLDEVRALVDAKKIIFTGVKEKDEFVAKLEKAEEALDNYLDDEDEAS